MQNKVPAKGRRGRRTDKRTNSGTREIAERRLCLKDHPQRAYRWSNHSEHLKRPTDPKRRFTAHSKTLARAVTAGCSRSVVECGAKHRFGYSGTTIQVTPIAGGLPVSVVPMQNRVPAKGRRQRRNGGRTRPIPLASPILHPHARSNEFCLILLILSNHPTPKLSLPIERTRRSERTQPMES
jgi:hypothetical protein